MKKQQVMKYKSHMAFKSQQFNLNIVNFGFIYIIIILKTTITYFLRCQELEHQCYTKVLPKFDGRVTDQLYYIT